MQKLASLDTNALLVHSGLNLKDESGNRTSANKIQAFDYSIVKSNNEDIKTAKDGTQIVGSVETLIQAAYDKIKAANDGRIIGVATEKNDRIKADYELRASIEEVATSLKNIFRAEGDSLYIT